VRVAEVGLGDHCASLEHSSQPPHGRRRHHAEDDEGQQRCKRKYGALPWCNALVVAVSLEQAFDSGCGRASTAQRGESGG